MPAPQQQQQQLEQRTSNASSWWERSIVKRSTSSIQNMVDTMMEDAHFLQRHDQEATNAYSNLLLLNRDNIQIGPLLGKGSFSLVSEVTGLLEQREPEHDCTFGSRSALDRTSLSGRYAIKHLRPDLVPKPETFQAAAADLLLEAKYLAALNHPGILKLRAVAQGGVSAFEQAGGQYDGFFLITDRLQGTLREKILEWQVQQQEESLLECFQPSALEESKDEGINTTRLLTGKRLLMQKLDIAQQIASALQYMHDQRLIFRDLKPPNVGIAANNRVQLFDFGFCRELPSWGGEEYAYQQLEEHKNGDEDDALYYMSGKGSLMYLAPEVLQNGRYNRKADCYSFSMVLYETLTLNKPFHSPGNIEIFRNLLCRHKARPPLEYSDVPSQLQDLIRHSWDDNVRERWTMKQIHQRLQEISQELDPSLSPSEQQRQHVQDQQMFSDPVTCGAGGFVLDVLTGFAHDLHLGYEILLGNNKNKVLEMQHHQEFRSGPIMVEPQIQPPDAVQCRDASDTGEVTEILTAATEASSILTCDSHQSLRITAMTATEEPLEVTLEEAMSIPGWNDIDDFHPEHQEEVYAVLAPCATVENEERGTEDAEELRCPPSPPLERTTSAPLDLKTVPVPLSPHFPQRRQSMGSSIKGSFYNLPEDLPPPFPPIQRRQSTGGAGFVFSQDHFLPSAVELRGY